MSLRWRPVRDWATRPGVHRRHPDPYLVWAELSGWQAFRTSVDTPVHAVPVLVELVDGEPDTVSAFRRACAADGEAMCPPVWQRGCFVTAWLSVGALARLASPAQPLGAWVRQFEISLPVRSPRTFAAAPAAAWAAAPAAPPLRGTVLLGVIDSGCPFAHPSLSTVDQGRASSRVAALWSASHKGPRFDARETPPAGFGHGHEIRRASQPGAGGRIGIDDFIAAQRRASDEALYEQAGYAEMRSSVSHGAHVLDLLLGPVPLRQRLPLAPGHTDWDPDAVPSWAQALPADDPCADPQRSDLVCVDLPRSAIQDSSGGWLSAHLWDAVNYIVGCAGEATRAVYINISYGCATGPHDGSSLLERALHSLVQPREGTAPVQLVLAAGNSFGAAGHATLHPGVDGETVWLDWRVPPASETPAFLQCWLPAGAELAGLRLHLQAPDGQTTVVAADGCAVLSAAASAAPVATLLHLARSSRGDGAMALVALAPTEHPDARLACAPCGLWRLGASIAEGQTLAEPVHVYLARNDQDLGTRLRGRPSSLWAEPDPARHLAPARDDAGLRHDPLRPGAASGAAARLRRRGSTNGIATARDAALHVVGGYRLRDGDQAPYSSAGQQGDRRGSGPTVAMPSDHSACLPGLRAAGNHGGGTVRLAGTSAAAPLYLRHLVRQQFGTPPTPGPSGPLPDAPLQPADLVGPRGRRGL